jgi:hypothetical protein
MTHQAGGAAGGAAAGQRGGAAAAARPGCSARCRGSGGGARQESALGTAAVAGGDDGFARRLEARGVRARAVRDDPAGLRATAGGGAASPLRTARGPTRHPATAGMGDARVSLAQAGAGACTPTPTPAADSLRVRVEIMGSQKCGIVGKSQSVLVMINPMIFTRTRTPERPLVCTTWWGRGVGCQHRGSESRTACVRALMLCLTLDGAHAVADARAPCSSSPGSAGCRGWLDRWQRTGY